MTDAIAKLRKLAGAATPTTWVAVKDHHEQWLVSAPDTGEDVCKIQPWGEPQDRADAEFIAAMRNALPALLDLVEAADRIHARLFHDIALMEPDEQDELTDYETKRAALAQALEVTDG